MRTTILLLISLSCFAKIFAQTGTIRGLVKDAESETALEGVNVQLADRSKAGVSNEFGVFNLANIAAGLYEMDISYTGYKTEVVKVAVQPNQVTDLAIGLKKHFLDLEDVKVSGRTNPSHTITSVDIRLRPLQTSQDILRMVPGLFIAQHAGGGKAEQIFLRGFDLDHGTDINISVDGMPVNMVSHAHGQGYADLHFVIPELVEKVRFEKGPYNAAYGNLATSSYVAFSTPEFLADQFVKAEVGSFKTTRIASAVKLLDKAKNNRHQQWYAAGEYVYSNGYFDKPQHFNRYNLFTRYSASFQNNTFLSFTASSFGSQWDASGQIPDRAVDLSIISRYGSIDSTEAGNTTRTNLNLILRHRINDKWTLDNQWYYSHYHFNLFSNFTFYLNDPVNGDEIQQWEDRHLFGYTGHLNYRGLIGKKHLKTSLGYGFRHDAVNDIQLNHVVKQVFLEQWQKGDIQETNLFAYWNNTLDISNKLQLNAGLRYDWFRFGYKDKMTDNHSFQSQSRAVVSPKLNLSYDASNKIKLFVSTGIGFHSNDTRVILQQQADKILPRVFGTDAGVLIKPAKSLLLKTVLWWMYSEQEFVYVGDEGIVEPSGESRRVGLDLMLRYQPLQWLYADFDLNLTKARSAGVAKGEDYIPLAAPLTSIGGLTVKLKNGLNASLRYRMIGKRPANENYTVTADGYFLLDALMSYRWRKIECSLSVQNLLNSEWKEAQFNTTSRLSFETDPVAEIHYTPGSPVFVKAGISFHF